jgi:hypothetical protein
MSLLRRPMTENAFWALIEKMGGRSDEQGITQLTEALEAQGPKAAQAFAERLAKLLYELDREVLFRQPVRFEDDDPSDLGDPDVQPIPLSDDTFVYLRAGVVTRGREAYEQVLSNPEELARGAWPECEDLLYVADEVVGDDVETKTSYETGSNRKRWSKEPAQPQREAWDVGLRAVWVDFRDLSDPMEIETHHADGHVEASVVYGTPRWLTSDLTNELTVTCSKLVTLGGGLPGDCGTQIQVRIDLGGSWQLSPRDEGVVTDELMLDEMRRVSVALDSATVRSWSVPVRREALLGLTAAGVLTVLPEGNDGRAALQELVDRGAGHLPT